MGPKLKETVGGLLYETCIMPPVEVSENRPSDIAGSESKVSSAHRKMLLSEARENVAHKGLGPAEQRIRPDLWPYIVATAEGRLGFQGLASSSYEQGLGGTPKVIPLRRVAQYWPYAPHVPLERTAKTKRGYNPNGRAEPLAAKLGCC